MSGLRSLLEAALRDVGMLIPDDRFDRTRRDAAAESARHLQGTLSGIGGYQAAVVGGSVGLSAGALARMFGHGWQQAAGFAAAAEVRRHRVGDVARLGALLSLGIVVFDHLADTDPLRRGMLVERSDPQRLGDHAGAVPERCGDPGIDFVGAVAAEVVSGAQKLGGRPADAQRFMDLLGEMYRGERASVEILRVDGPPSPQVWEALRAKSALPAAALAALATLGNPAVTDRARQVAERAAALVGEAFWIVDDLVDVQADAGAGCWSRPLWLLLSRPGEPPVSGRDAVGRLLDSGIAAAEARRLGQVLAELAALPVASKRALLYPVQAAVRSWIEEIPLDPPVPGTP